jgi:hypothetical protein
LRKRWKKHASRRREIALMMRSGETEERLEELRRREQDRILEVGGYSSYSFLLSVIHRSAVAGCSPSSHGDVFYTQGRRREDEEKKGRVDLEPINVTPGSVPRYFRTSILYVYFNTP